jgi:hypothetical protein
MNKIFDIYGGETNDLQLCREVIQSALGVQLEAHESSYLGNYYRWGKQYGEELILQKNYDESEQEFREERFKDFRTLLYVNLFSDPDEVRRRLAACSDQMVFLERKELI